MSRQEEVLVALARLLDRLQVPYMVVGGHANALWGEPRATLDIDVTVLLDESRLDELIGGLRPILAPRVSDPSSFVRETRVLPLATPDALGVDVIWGLLPFEEEAIRRAHTVAVEGWPVRFATAEDLILLKIISRRSRDRNDVRGIARRQGRELDLEYLEARIEELARLLDRPEIADFWRSLGVRSR